MLGNIHHQRALRAQKEFMRTGGFGHKNHISATVTTKGSPDVEASRAAIRRGPVNL